MIIKRGEFYRCTCLGHEGEVVQVIDVNGYWITFKYTYQKDSSKLERDIFIKDFVLLSEYEKNLMPFVK